MSTANLLEFLSDEKIKDFILLEKDLYTKKYPFGNNYFESNVKHYKNSLPNYENEILQIINTTDQTTIDKYFEKLLEYANHIKNQFQIENIRSSVELWNKKELDTYRDKIEKETEQYFSSTDRERKHLEQYETYRYEDYLAQGYGIREGAKKIKLVNYNFYCVEKEPDLIDPSYIEAFHSFLVDLTEEYLIVARKYAIPYSEGKIKSKVEKTIFNKPVVFVEGEHDITYITKAAELLNQIELLKLIELRQRGGWANLDKIWSIYKDNNWETISQKKLLLYDCDTRKKDEETGHVYKRVIPTVEGNMISKGIENLFPNSLIQKAINHKEAFIDITQISRIKRGLRSEEKILNVNEDEKTNLCAWICDEGKAEDFKHFQIVFDLINLVLQ